ncbi:6-phospho-beta-glucosidase [Anaerocolumna sp. MB42-C2]|uniref:6-phospho-beta-glucosidase n=1 Tax=Anaerocolumna sp. MB42-C2 TaxID=3070997 RepID=UPI0027E03CDD|nr:6-phospho-beta-glucosidase [Anaerocolumna sp. MB42-C2]WMJ86953.1 6-phospho-beta-glucosidase [Anaerocolumna sp. MB42-C2]
MSEGIKIVTIGGGSSYTPELVEGFIKRYDKLPVRELWLVDIKEGQHKLEIVGNLAKRMVDKAGVPMKIYTTLNRREALVNADFVTTQLRVGLLEARIKDERIPLSYGMFGQETNGAGGLFKGLRTIPVLLDICKDMDELCKDAWLINFTNPVGMVMEAINRYSSRKKVIGLCNVPIDTHKAIARILEKPVEEVFATFGGLNHMVYVTGVSVDGNNVMDKVIEKWGRQSVKNIKGIEWEPGFLKELGVIPCSYHRYYYMAKEYLEEAIENYKQHGTRAEKVKKIEEELFEIYKDENLAEKPKQLEQRGGAYYSDAACNLISSIYNDTRDIQVVNTVNRGALTVLEYDEIAEISCMITKDGPIPISVGKLPKAVNGLIQQIKSFEVAGSEAAVTGDYNKALLAMMINPLVGSQSYAIKVLDELLKAHEKYLPRFFAHDTIHRA